MPRWQTIGESDTIPAMDHLLGHAKPLSLLQAAIASDRLHHAWIFHGPQGVGKFTAAIALAKLILCHQPQATLTGEMTACETCPSCTLLRHQTPSQSPIETAADEDASDDDAGDGSGDDDSALASAHPDLHIITKELARWSDDASVRRAKLTTIPVDIIRHQLVAAAGHRPQLGHRKVFIVDEAELMNMESQNAMLKTLEEPPPDTFILLITSSEDKLLPTVRSRCQRLAFGAIPHELLEQWLDANMPELSAGDREWVLSFADGSLGRIILARDYNLFAWYMPVLGAIDQAVNGRAEPSLGQQMTTFIDELAKTWVARHKNASKEAANKMAAGLMFHMIAQHARRGMIHAAAGLSPDDPDTASQRMTPWLNIIDALGQTQRTLGANVNMSLAMDHLASMIARPNMLHSLGA